MSYLQPNSLTFKKYQAWQLDDYYGWNFEGERFWGC